MDLTVRDYHGAGIVQVLDDQCSIAGNQASDLTFIVNEQLSSDGCVRSRGSTLAGVMPGGLELLKPRNNELIHGGRADCRDRHSVQCNDRLKDLVPVGFTKRFLKGEASSFDERVERYGIATERDEGDASPRGDRCDNEPAPEGTQSAGRA
jgi:hypothetical protein